MTKHIDTFKTLFEYLNFFLEPIEYQIFLHHVQQDSRGFFILLNTAQAEKKYNLKQKDLRKIVLRIEGLARLFEAILLERE